MPILRTWDEAEAPVVSGFVDFNNSDDAPRESTLVFDLRALPPELVVSFRVAGGFPLAVGANVSERGAADEDEAPPDGFDEPVYEVSPGTVGEVHASLPPFGVVSTFVSVRNAGKLPPGEVYTFEVQQWTATPPPALANVRAKRFLRGGVTFAVPIAAPEPPLPPPPPREPEEHGPPPPPWTPPFLDGPVRRRYEEAFRRVTTGPRVTAVTVTNDRVSYTGPCPVTITFTATFTVTGEAGVLSYVWERSDGSLGAVSQLRTTGPGTYTAATTWRRGAAGQSFGGWQAVRVLATPPLRSARSEFAVTCT